ncbi:MAG: hypothetical protein GF331_19055 [Chitinivibrionales bacterium]|nr:hypothetical protein [Chitinivibrionales bacterium]
MQDPQFNALTYLAKRYGPDGNIGGHLHSSYGVDDSNTDHPFTPPMAMGFWLRRGIDGTDSVLWDGLSELMTRYDSDWGSSNGRLPR